ncbi:hypothetical protein F5884DRAFT_499702 [Xylogone sp. PMI_703]|nr:hypothetical protein F5884DRAFT_499702 [Xylogone sp. PMI_703]
MDKVAQTINSVSLKEPISLIEFLSNPLFLYRTVPYLPVSSLLALGATSKSFQTLIHKTPKVFRHLDLSETGSLPRRITAIDQGGEVWRNVQLDENVTEDDFYSGPLRGVFSSLHRRNVLKDVQTLILDGLCVTADLVSDIILDSSLSIRMLSIREVLYLNERKLIQALLYAVRPSRPEKTPKLEALYVFGRKEDPRHPTNPSPHSSVTSSRMDDIVCEMTQDERKWFHERGRLFDREPKKEWADVLVACQGIISFDAVLCDGPRHSALTTTVKQTDTNGVPWYNNANAYLRAEIANYVMKPCDTCQSAPEKILRFGKSTYDRFPLLAPPPLHSSRARDAKAVSIFPRDSVKLLARCLSCIQKSWCKSCNKWWCEDCYEPNRSGSSYHEEAPQSVSGINGQTASDSIQKQKFKIGLYRSCVACGFVCAECVSKTELKCRVCTGGYCTIHNEGSTSTICDCMWLCKLQF